MEVGLEDLYDSIKKMPRERNNIGKKSGNHRKIPPPVNFQPNLQRHGASQQSYLQSLLSPACFFVFKQLFLSLECKRTASFLFLFLFFFGRKHLSSSWGIMTLDSFHLGRHIWIRLIKLPGRQNRNHKAKSWILTNDAQMVPKAHSELYTAQEPVVTAHKEQKQTQLLTISLLMAGTRQATCSSESLHKYDFV